MNRADLIPLAGLLLCGGGGVMLCTVTRRILKLAGLILLYLGGSILLLSVCSFQVCAALLVCGIGSVVLLGTGNHSGSAQKGETSSVWAVLVFRGIMSLMLGIAAFTASDSLRLWIPVRRNVLFVCLWICLMSLFSLSIEDQMLHRCIHLQAICLAFTLCYIYMENSMLVFACFTVINLLLAFSGAMLTPENTKHSAVPTEENE